MSCLIFHLKLKHIIVQFNIEQLSTVQYNTVQFSIVQYNSGQFILKY